MEHKCFEFFKCLFKAGLPYLTRRDVEVEVEVEVELEVEVVRVPKFPEVSGGYRS